MPSGRRSASSRAPTRSSSCTGARSAASWAPARTCPSSSASTARRASSPATWPRSWPTRTGSSSSRRATSPTSTRTGSSSPTSTASSSTGPRSLVDWSAEAAEKGGFDHFMLKEIHEQPESLRQCIAGRITRDGEIRLAEIDGLADRIAAATRVELVACGSAYYAALVGAAAIEEWTGLPARATVGSEFRYSPPPLDGPTLVIAVTQSGETADTIAPTRHAREQRLPDRGGDEHRRVGDHPGGRRGRLPPGRTGDRGRRVEDVHDPGHDPRHPGRGDRPDPRHARSRRRSASSSRLSTPCPAPPSARSTASDGARARHRPALRQLARLHVRRARLRVCRRRSRAP